MKERLGNHDGRFGRVMQAAKMKNQDFELNEITLMKTIHILVQ